MIEPRRMTIAEFDRFCETADESLIYELHDGVVLLFSTGTVTHGRLCSRVGWLLAKRMPNECQIF